MPLRPSATFRAASSTPEPLGQKQNDANDEEEDYMSMVIEEPKTQRETLTQRKLRKQRESEAKARVPSKAEREAAEAARREAALATSTLNPASKGYQMMAKLGYKPGTALGKPDPTEHGSKETSETRSDQQWKSMRARLLEPIAITVKEDRGGIGLDTEKKRKIREQVETEAKRAKAEVGEYRERVRLEREERRKEAQFHAAQKVAERLDAEEEEEQAGQIVVDSAQSQTEGDKGSDVDDEPKRPKRNLKPLSQINILYRGLIRSREEKLRELQAQQRRYDSLSGGPRRFFSEISGLPTFDDPTLEPDDKLALSRTVEGDVVEDELEEDEELEAFNALSAGERLSRIVTYLRDKYHYCFWCKYRYENADMEGCPGLTEEDHD
ncbi:hypothetical protein VTO42DRAFT_6625 [Malbranchea cinnamomea]